MRAIPFHHCEFLSKENIHIYECSDRILIPQSVFKSMGFSEGPILLHISNTIGNYVCGTLHNVHDCQRDYAIYMPSWMIHALDVTENLSISCLPKHACKKMSLRPHNNGILGVHEWHLKFAGSIRSYNTLTIGARIPIVIDGRYMFMSIVGLNDSKYNTYYLVNGEEISIEILHPVESIAHKDETHTVSYLYRNPRTITDTHNCEPFTGVSRVLGGEVCDRPVRELAAEAALKRRKKLPEKTHTTCGNHRIMIVKPICYLEHLTDRDLEKYECSDKIWLGRTEYERWITSSEPGISTIVKLTNKLEQSAVGLVYSMHYNDLDDNTVYVPFWMYRLLELDTEDVTLSRFEGSLCTGLTIQPHTSDHLTAPDPQELLRDAFEQYSCLTPGQEIPLWISFPEPHTFYVTITKLMPKEETLCIQNCEIELELMPPMDIPVPPAPATATAPAPTPASAFVLPESNCIIPQESSGYRLSGTIPIGKTRRELALEAALRRLNAPTND